MDRVVVMRSFVAVGDEGSFSRAAKTLGISGSLVSRHISDLEKYLDIRLVNRTARAVSLTAAGRRHHEFARHLLDELDTEDTSLRGLRDRAEGPLAVICPKWIGNLDLGEAIAEFAVDHPKIHVRFEVGGMSDRAFDFLDQGYDVAFHTRELRDSTMLLRKLTDLEFELCASPDYLAKHDPLVAPMDLADHDCLVHINDPIWYLHADGEELNFKVTEPVYSSNSYLTLRKAAVHGRGIALMPVRTAAEDIAAGRLQRVLPEYQGPARSLYAVHSPGSHTLRKVRVFLDYVANWFVKNPIGRPEA
ncbi:MAG: LysR family transcriptional regulator [Nocardioides sp.]|uniref:LysR family transcriptional regulator n=1 Tax=Nocardioides sp. TaxID=35761 RepID=UPI0039E29223